MYIIWASNPVLGDICRRPKGTSLFNVALVRATPYPTQSTSPQTNLSSLYPFHAMLTSVHAESSWKSRKKIVNHKYQKLYALQSLITRGTHQMRSIGNTKLS